MLWDTALLSMACLFPRVIDSMNIDNKSHSTKYKGEKLGIL